MTRPINELIVNEYAKRVLNLLYKHALLVRTDYLFELANPLTSNEQKVSQHQRERRKFSFNRLINDLWAHRLVERLRVKVPRTYRPSWRPPIASIRRADVQELGDIRLAMKLEAVRWSVFQDIEGPMFDAPDASDDVEVIYVNQSIGYDDDPFALANRESGEERRPLPPLTSCVTWEEDPAAYFQWYSALQLGDLYYVLNKLGHELSQVWRATPATPHGCMAQSYYMDENFDVVCLSRLKKKEDQIIDAANFYFEYDSVNPTQTIVFQ